MNIYETDQATMGMVDPETGEIPEERDERFQIRDDQQAEWALGKIAEARAELEKWEAFYGQKLEAIRKETQNTIDFMTFHLHRFFDTQERRVTKTGIEKYSLPSGELIRKPAGIDYTLDEAALLAWCEANLPEAVKVTRKAGWAEVKDYIKNTGEIPDGVTVEETSPTFQVKEAK